MNFELLIEKTLTLGITIFTNIIPTLVNMSIEHGIHELFLKFDNVIIVDSVYSLLQTNRLILNRLFI